MSEDLLFLCCKPVHLALQKLIKVRLGAEAWWVSRSRVTRMALRSEPRDTSVLHEAIGSSEEVARDMSGELVHADVTRVGSASLRTP